MLLACALLAASALITLSGAAGRKTISAEEAYAKFVGEWVSMEYVGIIYYPQKLVIKPIRWVFILPRVMPHVPMLHRPVTTNKLSKRGNRPSLRHAAYFPPSKKYL